jgi:glycosidase
MFAELGTEYPPIYNFADNHDVNRAYSLLKNKTHIFLVYALLYTIPGIPSIYYGSEYCKEGVRDKWTDRALRPLWKDIDKGRKDLLNFIQALARIRERHPFLKGAPYRQLALSNTEFAFCREFRDQSVLVALNISGKSQRLELPVGGGCWSDSFFPENTLSTADGKLVLTLLPGSVQIWEKR